MTDERIRIAALQMTSGADLARNLDDAAALLAEAAARGAGLAVLPEVFAFMGHNDTERHALAEEDGAGPVQAFLAEQAARHRLWLVGGTHPLRAANDTERSFAACLVYGPQGQRMARYDKMHLFDVQLPGGQESYHESARTRPGTTVGTVAVDGARLGLSVCYDLRFPELYRELAAQGAELLAVPSAFTARTGRAHWEILLRARAVENQAVVIGAAQVGRHPSGRDTWGHSMIVGPWGDVLAERTEPTPGVVLAEVDMVHLRELRRRFPVLTHRRSDL